MTKRVWHITNFPSDPDYYPVETVGEAKRTIDAVANAQLKCECTVTNMFGLEILTDGEWEEWEDDNGNQILDLGARYDQN